MIFGDTEMAEEKAMGQFGRITRVADLPSDEVLIGYVKKAAALNDAGVKSPTRSKPRDQQAKPLEIPDYFSDALQKNAKAKKTFEDFTPGKRKEYIEWVTEAKREETRTKRLATSIEWLAEGKQRMWKHQPQPK